MSALNTSIGCLSQPSTLRLERSPNPGSELLDGNNRSTSNHQHASICLISRGRSYYWIPGLYLIDVGCGRRALGPARICFASGIVGLGYCCLLQSCQTTSRGKARAACLPGNLVFLWAGDCRRSKPVGSALIVNAES